MNFDRARSTVVSTCRFLADEGFLAGTGGNVACRVDDKHFVITPSATDYYAMSPEDICVVRLDSLTRVEGNRNPSVELRLHAEVLRARQDCSASIHTHQPIASAYSLLGCALEITDPDQRDLLGPKVAFVPYAPSGTSWLAARLAKALSPGVNAYFLGNHGVVCCGPTLDRTIAGVEALESACADFFRGVINERLRMGGEDYLFEILSLLANSREMEFAQ